MELKTLPESADKSHSAIKRLSREKNRTNRNPSVIRGLGRVDKVREESCICEAHGES
jgi:hypothetical protein